MQKPSATELLARINRARVAHGFKPLEELSRSEITTRPRTAKPSNEASRSTTMQNIKLSTIKTRLDLLKARTPTLNQAMLHEAYNSEHGSLSADCETVYSRDPVGKGLKLNFKNAGHLKDILLVGASIGRNLAG